MSGFLDTNILIYAFGDDDRRRPPAQRLIRHENTFSVQVLNEFASVASRKLRRTWTEIGAAIDSIMETCGPALPVTTQLNRQALQVCERHRLSFYDALIVAASLEAGCDALYSEDMHAGLVVDGRLTIINPFA